jgi:CpeT protein
MRAVLIFILALTFIWGCTGQKNELETLVGYMTGTFSTAEQAQSDTNYYNITLHQVRIWPGRTDGYWLYVEQAASDRIEQPYRQRVYHLAQVSDSTYQSTVYALKNPEKYIGDWEKANPLEDIDPGSLTERDGCAVILQKYGTDTFVGSTESLRCDSNLRGAAYSTSIVLITPTQMYSWDRGFDIDGDQVWGARDGGYVFKKESMKK